MRRRSRPSLASRKRSASKLQKMSGWLKGKPSALDILLKERRGELHGKGSRLKGAHRKES